MPRKRKPPVPIGPKCLGCGQFIPLMYYYQLCDQCLPIRRGMVTRSYRNREMG